MGKSYSQCGQDLMAEKFFQHYPASQKVFLDIGAFDGINFSSTHLFFQQGWAGFASNPS
jgi:hypothetical protein